MKTVSTWAFLTVICVQQCMAGAELQLRPSAEPHRVFAGPAREIPLVWHNAGDQTAVAVIRAHLYQISSSTAAPLSERLWKSLEVLPGQTVLETAKVDFPAVNAETHFLVQWVDNGDRVLGKSEVLVYPTNLFADLKPLLRDGSLGVLDPNNELKPLLKQNDVAFLDLADTPLGDFRGRLAIVGPFHLKHQMREGLAQTIQRIASKGAAVVWLQPPRDLRDPIKPSFYIVQEGKAAVLVVEGETVANMSDNPQPQTDLVYFCKLALNPVPPALPNVFLQQ